MIFLLDELLTVLNDDTLVAVVHALTCEVVHRSIVVEDDAAVGGDGTDTSSLATVDAERQTLGCDSGDRTEDGAHRLHRLRTESTIELVVGRDEPVTGLQSGLVVRASEGECCIGRSRCRISLDNFDTGELINSFIVSTPDEYRCVSGQSGS